VISRTLFFGLVLSLNPCSKLALTSQAEPAPTSASQPAPPSAEEAALADAKKLAAQGDLQSAHLRLVSTLPDTSPLRQSPDFKNIENRWAAATTTGASDDPDLLGRRRALAEVASSTSVDASYQAKAKALLLSLPTQPAPLPQGTSTTARTGGGATFRGPAAGFSSSTETIEFAAGSATLGDGGRRAADKVATSIKTNPRVAAVEVKGYSEREDPKRARALNNDRASATVAYLTKKGVPATLFAGGPMDDSGLRDMSDDMMKRMGVKKNPRVEVTITIHGLPEGVTVTTTGGR
jgi:outer membrane protein OmpA-like peptidoglycan-associated protein